jgi:diguanylate cyclase (GGDEF)-like protein/PAS domain S-box-containing protein
MRSGRPSRGNAVALSDRSARRIIELSSDIACVVGFDGEFKQLNASWHRELGHEVRELVAAPYLSLVHPEDRDETVRRMAMVTSGQADAVEIENRFHRHDGTYRWLRWHMTVDSGERVLFCLAQDVTDQKAGDGAPDSAARYGLMFDATDAIAVTDGDAVLTYISQACLPLLGYAPEELVGRPIARLIHPEDRALAGIARKRGARAADTSSVTLRYQRKDNSYAWIESRSKSIIDPLTGAVRETLAVMRDVGERKEAQLAVERLALTDALTGLANRLLLSDRLNQCLRRLKRTPGLVGVLMLDLDHFKVINDTLGHQVGDAVLAAAAHRLQRLARPDDTVARFGGDEFVVIVQGLTRSADLSALADRIVTGLREPYQIGERKEEVATTVSIGIALTSQPDHLATDLLREADLALYRAKDRGRDRHEVYGEALEARAVERLETEQLLRRAMSEGQLALAYQPIIDLATGTTVEAEALLRIDDADFGRLMPERFLSVAEESGLLSSMDDWVRATALTQLAAWRANGSLGSLERIAVNATARDLASADFASRLAACLSNAGLDGRDLTIEVTEHVLMQASNSAVNVLVELRSLGVRIGLDDFGTGFSALSYLQTFPLDFIKIDRSIVERIPKDRRSSSVISAIIRLAHALDLTVVAEGVESEEQLAALSSFGCDRVQGFLLSQPLTTDEFSVHLEAQRRWAARSLPPGVATRNQNGHVRALGLRL